MYHWITPVLAFITFYSIDHKFLRRGPPAHIICDQTAFTRLRNYILSLLHAVISGAGSLLWYVVNEDPTRYHETNSLYLFPELREDIVLRTNKPSFHVLGFTLGYLIHDIHHNISGGVSRKSVEILIHHVIIIVCFVVIFNYRLLVPYALAGLLMEINSVFLHIRQLFLLLNVTPTSWLYRINCIANLTTFVVLRICLTSWLFTWALLNRPRMPVLLYLIAIATYFVLLSMNVVLFGRIIASEKRILTSPDQLLKARNHP